MGYYVFVCMCSTYAVTNIGYHFLRLRVKEGITDAAQEAGMFEEEFKYLPR